MATGCSREKIRDYGNHGTSANGFGRLSDQPSLNYLVHVYSEPQGDVVDGHSSDAAKQPYPLRRVIRLNESAQLLQRQQRYLAAVKTLRQRRMDPVDGRMGNSSRRISAWPPLVVPSTVTVSLERQGRGFANTIGVLAMANYPDFVTDIRKANSTTGYQQALAFERDNLDAHGRIHDADGRLSPIVHQFDRLVESFALRAWRKRFGPSVPWPERAPDHWSSVEALQNDTCISGHPPTMPPTATRCGTRLRLPALEAAVRAADHEHDQRNTKNRAW